MAMTMATDLVTIPGAMMMTADESALLGRASIARLEDGPLLPAERCAALVAKLDAIERCGKARAKAICSAICGQYPGDPMHRNIEPETFTAFVGGCVAAISPLHYDLAREMPRAVCVLHASAFVPSVGQIDRVARALAAPRARMRVLLQLMGREHSRRERVAAERAARLEWRREVTKAGGWETYWRGKFENDPELLGFYLRTTAGGALARKELPDNPKDGDEEDDDDDDEA